MLMLAFASGIFLHSVMDVDAWVVSIFVFISIVPVLINARWATVGVLLCFVVAGYFTSYADVDRDATSVRNLYENGWIKSRDPVEVIGRIHSQPIQTPAGKTLIVAVETLIFKNEAIETSGKVRLYVNQSEDSRQECLKSPLVAGNIIRLSTRLRREEPFRNPGGRSAIRLLDQRQIAAVGFLKS